MEMLEREEELLGASYDTDEMPDFDSDMSGMEEEGGKSRGSPREE